MVFLEILFALTVAEILVTQYVVVPAIAVGATAGGIYGVVKGSQELAEHRHDAQGFKEEVVDNMKDGWKWVKDLFDKRGEPMPDLTGSNAAVWFHDTGMNRADLEVLRGMTIRPHPDEGKVDRAMFVKGSVAVEGSFMGVDKKHLDGIRTGNFSAIYPGIGAALEGDWIVVNRTEASDETAARFERLRSSFSSLQMGSDVGRKILFKELLDTALDTQTEEDAQSRDQEGKIEQKA